MSAGVCLGTLLLLLLLCWVGRRVCWCLGTRSGGGMYLSSYSSSSSSSSRLMPSRADELPKRYMYKKSHYPRRSQSSSSSSFLLSYAKCPRCLEASLRECNCSSSCSERNYLGRYCDFVCRSTTPFPLFSIGSYLRSHAMLAVLFFDMQVHHTTLPFRLVPKSRLEGLALVYFPYICTGVSK